MTFPSVPASPHVRGEKTVRTMMVNVFVALIPCAIWGIYLFGLRAAVMFLVGVGSAVLWEALWCALFRRAKGVRDASAMVTGLMVALLLPVSSSLLTVMLTTFLAVIPLKALFGGLGRNLLNPAVGAVCLLRLLFPLDVGQYTAPHSDLSPIVPTLAVNDLKEAIVSSPLAILQSGKTELLPDSVRLVIGETAGNLGETGSLLILLGLAYLLMKRVISWQIPVSFLLSTAALLWFLPSPLPASENVLYHLCSGSLLFCAVFCATDPCTSPVTSLGKICYGIFCGLLTVFLRSLGIEGALYAVLFSNLVFRVADRIFRSRPFGLRRRASTRKSVPPSPAP